MPVKELKNQLLLNQKKCLTLQKIDLDMKFIWGWNAMVHTTRRQVPFGPPYKDFHKMRLDKVFCPCLKKSLSWYTLKKKNGSLNSWASPAENNSDASAKTHQTNSDPSSNSRYYQPLLATFIYHPPLHCSSVIQDINFPKKATKVWILFWTYIILKRNQLKMSASHIVSVWKKSAQLWMADQSENGILKFELIFMQWYNEGRWLLKLTVF